MPSSHVANVMERGAGALVIARRGYGRRATIATGGDYHDYSLFLSGLIDCRSALYLTRSNSGGVSLMYEIKVNGLFMDSKLTFKGALALVTVKFHTRDNVTIEKRGAIQWASGGKKL